ncbi:MAG: hypothetical protein ACLQF1_11600 [Methyloceanibacter sp.]
MTERADTASSVDRWAWRRFIELLQAHFLSPVSSLVFKTLGFLAAAVISAEICSHASEPNGSDNFKLAMRQAAVPVFCATTLIGCASASPSFVKLDASGKRDVSANPETLERDVADCKVLEAHVRAEAGTFFNTSAVRMAFANCMRSKGYIES